MDKMLLKLQNKQSNTAPVLKKKKKKLPSPASRVKQCVHSTKAPQARTGLEAQIQPLLLLPDHASWTREESGQKTEVLSIVCTKMLRMLATAYIFARSR